MDPGKYTCLVLSNKDPRTSEIRTIRTDVFCHEQKLLSVETVAREDPDDTVALMILDPHTGRGMGTVRFDGTQERNLRLMAIRSEYRHRGVGRQLVLALEEHLRRTQGAGSIYLRSELETLAFYERCGFVAVSEIVEAPENLRPEQRYIWVRKVVDSETPIDTPVLVYDR